MLTVPNKAVRENQDGKYVYVLLKIIRLTYVSLSRYDKDDDVAIISGLNEGDKGYYNRRKL